MIVTEGQAAIETAISAPIIDRPAEGVTRPSYFPGLDTLRFYAALAVVVAHIRHNFGEMRTVAANVPLLDALFVDAQTAVSLFFVLSGFLITYLLFVEKERTGRVNIRQFYLRRALRIWPLYYLIVVVCLVLLPLILGPDYFHANAPARIVIPVLFFLANLVGPLGPLHHLWSISLEEQFYLVWPWVMKRNITLFLKFTVGIIILKLFLEPAIAAFNVEVMMKVFLGLRFECMAIGALGAYVYVHQHALLRWAYHPVAQVTAWGVMILCALVDIPLTVFNTLLLSVVFVVLILNLATNSQALIQIDHPAFNALGKVSYGIYMYHYPLLYALLFIRPLTGIPEGDLYNAVLYAGTIGGTLLLAFVSYYSFEAPFLKLKKRFAVRASVAG